MKLTAAPTSPIPSTSLACRHSRCPADLLGMASLLGSKSPLPPSKRSWRCASPTLMSRPHRGTSGGRHCDQADADGIRFPSNKMYFSVEPEESQLKQAIEYLDAQHFLYASDIPDG